MQLFFHGKIASGIDRGRVSPTATSHNMAAILLSPAANTKYWFTAYFFDV